jgi:plastocyanin
MRRLVLLIGVVVSVGGCASQNPPQAGGPAPGAVVVMHLHSFEPSTVSIKSGQTVRWDNKSFIWHTVTADPAAAKDPSHVELPQGAPAFDSGKVEAGASYSRTFTVPGTYRYICRPHETKGMLGTIVVAPAGPN